MRPAHVLVAVTRVAGWSLTTAAQPLGTGRWQLQPCCSAARQAVE